MAPHCVPRPARALSARFDTARVLSRVPGRFTAEKGPHVAIRIAKAVGMQLRIAAKISRGEQRYFAERIKPLVDGEQIQLVGEVDDNAKQDFLSQAAALLFPIDWPEPFGLVMIEAMACGTPVIAYRSGSVPEVIDHGITGFVVDNEAEAITAIRQLDKLDRTRVREQFERRFTAQRMAREYARSLQEIAEWVCGWPHRNPVGSPTRLQIVGSKPGQSRFRRGFVWLWMEARPLGPFMASLRYAAACPLTIVRRPIGGLGCHARAWAGGIERRADH